MIKIGRNFLERSATRFKNYVRLVFHVNHDEKVRSGLSPLSRKFFKNTGQSSHFQIDRKIITLALPSPVSLVKRKFTLHCQSISQPTVL